MLLMSDVMPEAAAGSARSSDPGETLAQANRSTACSQYIGRNMSPAYRFETSRVAKVPGSIPGEGKIKSKGADKRGPL